MTERTDWWKKQPSRNNGLRLRRPEVLRSMRHHLRAQSQGHHTIDRLEEREAWKEESARRSFLKIEGYRQSDEHWNCFKGNVGETYEIRGDAHMGFSERIDYHLKLNSLDLYLVPRRREHGPLVPRRQRGGVGELELVVVVCSKSFCPALSNLMI